MWCFLSSEENLLWCCHGYADRRLSLGLLLGPYSLPWDCYSSKKAFASLSCLAFAQQQRSQSSKQAAAFWSFYRAEHILSLPAIIIRTTGAHICDQEPKANGAFSFVVKIWSQAQLKGYGKSWQDKTPKSVSGCVLVLTKQGPKQEGAMGPWERDTTPPS